MIEEFQSVSHLNVDLYYEWENVDFENTKEDIIFRIIQETMTNALRHGHASHIEIHLFDEDEKYMIIMQDNGSGCKEIHYGYGLKQMHERVAILNGTIHFYSEEGFRTVVEIPKIGGKKFKYFCRNIRIDHRSTIINCTNGMIKFIHADAF